MNHVRQHAFEAAWPGNVVTQFLPNKLKFNAIPAQKPQPVTGLEIATDTVAFAT